MPETARMEQDVGPNGPSRLRGFNIERVSRIIRLRQDGEPLPSGGQESDVEAAEAILKAYAIASEGRYEDAEELLHDAPGALDDPSGADLHARICREMGDHAAARRIWEGILLSHPDFTDASDALVELDEMVPAEYDDRASGVKLFWVIAAVLLGLLGILVAYLVRLGSDTEPQSLLSELTNGVQMTSIAGNSAGQRPSVVTNEAMSGSPMYAGAAKEDSCHTPVVTNMVEVVKYRDRVVTNTVEVVKYRDRVVTNIVEVVKYRDRFVTNEVPVVEYVDRAVTNEVPVVEYRDRFVTNEVHVVKYVDRVVTNEVPVVEYVDRVVTNEVPVVEYVDRVVTNEVPVVEYVDRFITNTVAVVEYVDRVVTNEVLVVKEVPVLKDNSVYKEAHVVRPGGSHRQDQAVAAAKPNAVSRSSLAARAERAARAGMVDPNTAPVARDQRRQHRKRRLTTPYIVKSGDTVSGLAVRYRFRIPDFKSCNMDVDINRIRVGQRLMLPGDYQVE